VRELVLSEPVQEVALVLVGVACAEQAVAPAAGNVGVLERVHPRVVAGRNGRAVVVAQRLAQEGAELHVAVAVDARAGRAAREVRVEERLEHARAELALQVEHIERDPELTGNAAGVVGGVQGATALLELAVRVGHVVEPHPDADGLDTLLSKESRGDRRVDTARHRDEHALAHHSSSPAGTAATGAERSRAIVCGTTSTA
jgi:hypothetical protein